MKQNLIETIFGGIVILAAAMFLYFAVHSQEHRKSGTFELQAHFSDVDGLVPGSAVRISGVKAGTISKIVLDPATFQVTVHMMMNHDFENKIPKDTLATVTSPGLLGDKYLALEPGNADEKLANGDLISDTQSSASLEKLLGQVIFSLQNLGKSPSSGSPQAPATPAAAATAASPADHP